MKWAHHHLPVEKKTVNKWCSVVILFVSLCVCVWYVLWLHYCAGSCRVVRPFVTVLFFVLYFALYCPASQSSATFCGILFECISMGSLAGSFFRSLFIYLFVQQQQLHSKLMLLLSLRIFTTMNETFCKYGSHIMNGSDGGFYPL